eukprot:gene16198-20682_t
MVNIKVSQLIKSPENSRIHCICSSFTPMLLVASLLAAPAVADVLRPAYHLTREQYEMNDPNGLMALRRQDGSTFPAYDYHMYFQSQNPGQQRGSEW